MTIKENAKQAGGFSLSSQPDIKQNKKERELLKK
jgi:hypothetical protein